jgi:hypothetical protein
MARENNTRVYLITTVADSRSILREGFTDLHEECGQQGVYFADRVLDVNDGFEGDVTLCLDLRDDEFKRYEIVEEGARPGYRRMALVPAAVLNRFGPAKIFDHLYAGAGRVELLRSIRGWEQHGEECSEEESKESSRRHAQEMRAAIEFFDEIGWLAPEKLKEAKES